MSNSEGAKTTQEHEQNDQSQQEWETMARAWLSSCPEAKEVTMAEVEAWIDSNLASLPEGLRSMPRPDLCLRLISIQNCMRLPIHEGSENPDKDISMNVQKDVVMKHPAPLPSSSVNNLPKDSGLYFAKRNEACRKYELLVELEKLFSPVFSKHPKTTNEIVSEQ